MGRNEFDIAVTSMKKLVDKFADWGLTAGFVYTTVEGFLKFYGSEAVGDLIDTHQADIMDHAAFSHRQGPNDDGPDSIPAGAGKMVSTLFVEVVGVPETKK